MFAVVAMFGAIAVYIATFHSDFNKEHLSKFVTGVLVIVFAVAIISIILGLI